MFFYLHGVEIQFPISYRKPHVSYTVSYCGHHMATQQQTRSYMMLFPPRTGGRRGWHTRSYYTPHKTFILGALDVESFRKKMPESKIPATGPKISPL